MAAGSASVLLTAWACLAAPPLVAQWVEPPGRGWVTVAVYHQDTRHHYDTSGGRRPFFADGHAVSTAAFVTGAAGLAPGMDIWVQLAFQRLRYDDGAMNRAATGPGATDRGSG